MMPIKRLFLGDLSDDYLQLILKAVKWAEDTDATRWIQQIAEGKMELYDVGGGLIGVVQMPRCLWLEFLIGQGLIARRRELLVWLKEVAGDRPLEAMASRPGLVRLYNGMGFAPIGTWMRL